MIRDVDERNRRAAKTDAKDEAERNRSREGAVSGVLALQGSAGNRAVGGLLRARRAHIAQVSTRTLQRAGDPEGMMVDHAQSGFTLHHIIPENKLESLWEMLEAKKHFGQMKSGIQAVTERGLSQFDSAAQANVTKLLTSTIDDLLGEGKKWPKPDVAAIVAEGKAGAKSADIVEKFFPGMAEDGELKGDYKALVDGFNRHFKVIGTSSASAISATANPEADKDFLADEKAKEAIEKFIRWMPGNIHRGPSKRFTEKEDGELWNADLDDGGDKFESAAKKVVSAPQFKTLETLNAAIDSYLAAPDETTHLATISTCLDRMKAYSMTEYNKDQWAEVERGVGKKKKKKWTFTA